MSSGAKFRSAGAPRRVALGLAVLAIATGVVGAAAAPPAGDSDGPAIVQLHLPPGELSLGSAGAPLTMVEFTDYQCPYCRRFQAEVWPKLKRHYIDTGKLRFIVRDLPLEFHASAGPAAEAAHCAAEQGKFWSMHEALLGGGEDLAGGGIDRRATAVGLDPGPFHACLKAERYGEIIAAHAREADAAGIRGTPGFVIGRVVHGELQGARVEGALPYEQFDALLRELLLAATRS